MSSNDLEIYKEKGLTEKEAELVTNWLDRGRPGIGKLKAEQLLSIYVLGYSCDDLNKEFPEYELPMLLWARIQYAWDDAREKYRKGVTAQVVESAIAAKAESIRFITDVMSATHVAWRKDILKYLAAPDREEKPKCLPNSLHQYGALVQLLDDMMSPKTPASAPGDSGDPLSSPLVSINVNTNGDRPTIDITPSDVKEALQKDAKGKPDGKK